MKIDVKLNPFIVKMIGLLTQWQKASLEGDNETFEKLGKQRDKLLKKFNKECQWIIVTELKLKPKQEEI